MGVSGMGSGGGMVCISPRRPPPPRPRRNKPRNYVPCLAARRAMKMLLYTILYTIPNRAQRDEKILLYHN